MAAEPGKIEKPGRKKSLPGYLSKTAIVFATAAAVLLLQTLPAWLSGKLLPALAESAGIAGLEADVTSLGLNRAELRNARIRLEGRRSVSANTIRVHYRLPFYPFQKHLRVRRLEIIGLRINVVGQDGQWSVPGIYPELLENRREAKTGESRKNGKSSVYLQQLALSDCEIRIEQDGRTLSIPFTARINMPPEADSEWRARIGIRFSGDHLEGRAAWDRKSGNVKINFQSELKFSNYARILPSMQEKWFGGAVFRGEAAGIMKEGEPLRGWSGGLFFEQLTVRSRKMMFGVSDGKEFALRFNQPEPSYFDWACAGLEILRPFKAELAESAGRLTLSGGECSARGTLETRFPRQAGIRRELPVKHDFEFKWRFGERQGEWDYRSVLTESGWDDRFNGKFESLEAKCTGNIQDGRVRSQVRLAAPSLELEAGGQRVVVTEPVVAAAIVFDGGLSGEADVNLKKIELPEMNAHTGPLSLRLPLGGKDRGWLKFQNVNVRGYELAELDYAISRNDRRLELDGRVRQEILPGLQCVNRIALALSPEVSVEAELEIGSAGNGKTMALGNLAPALRGMTLDGDFSAGGRYCWSPKRQAGECRIALRNGTLKSEALKMEASGLEFGVNFPALPLLKTDSLQKLSCRELKIRDFRFENINADFLLDTRRTFVLENLSLNWCGGNVSTYSLRFAPGGRNVNGTVYFDGLNISQILVQSGVAAVEGDGTIYGRLPLTVGQDGILLKPGFFYSVPGETRNIRFGNLKNMLAAIPPGTPQYHQLDLAAEALKDFNYDWIKVDFHNEGDKLLLVSRFNGRPVNMLPFGYDEKSGGMVRTDGAKANFQGIRLELNSSLPLNRLLKFNAQMKKLFGGEK